MRYLLLATALTSPCVALAQQVTKDASLERLDSAAYYGAREGTNGIRFADWIVLPRQAFLYRHPHDAQRGQYAHRLRAGEWVHPVAEGPYWFKVVKANYSTETPDGEPIIYYLRTSAVRRKVGAGYQVEQITIH